MSSFPPQAREDSVGKRSSSLLSPRSSQCDRKLTTQTPAPIISCTKPLKSSLKYSSPRFYRTGWTASAPALPSARANSLPSRPKSVHFKDKDSELESVCFFRATGRPSSIFGSHSDTETETERENAPSTQSGAGALLKVIEISPIPSPHTAQDSNVRLESISLLPARPPLLRGTVRVRNIAFEKHVVARFTTDGWTTTSDTHARYIGTTSAGSGDGTWDQFAFTISLGSHAGHTGAAPCPLLFAVRYTVPGVGEWWDNNGGDDFRIVLGPARSPPPWAGPAIMSDAPFVNAAAFPRWPLVASRRVNAPPTPDLRARQTGAVCLPRTSGGHESVAMLFAV
ncbi:putative phosphatase regulatory subunit-domain-containing protein [Lactifluus subvellereus]|nr:putative phosphatase regulatory subunit-domain-containing protein [Lactifluus subvellereus]